MFFYVDKVRKFATSITEDEKLIAKFKKDEDEKLRVSVRATGTRFLGLSK